MDAAPTGRAAGPRTTCADRVDRNQDRDDLLDVTFIVRLSYESDAATPVEAAEDFLAVLREDADAMVFQVIDENDETLFVQPDSGRVMDGLELYADLRDWFDSDRPEPLG